MSSRSDPTGERGLAGAVLAANDDRPVVTTRLRIDGQVVSAALLLDSTEVDRRRGVGIGAVADAGLLHALWTLPEGLPMPLNTVNDLDLDTLSELGEGTIEFDDSRAMRTYRPIGTVCALAAVAANAGSAVRSVGAFPTIFRRLAMVTGPVVDQVDLDLACAYGVGVSHLAGDEWKTLLEPAAAELGVPAVYRWWIAEIAYRNYLAS